MLRRNKIMVFMPILLTCTLMAVINRTNSQSLPTVSFESATGSINKTAGTYSVAVKLSTPSNQNIAVHFATADGTAKSNSYGLGEDFKSTQGTLNFAPGETSKNVTVQISANPVVNLDRTFTITISNPENAQLGDLVVNAVTIIDDKRSGIIDIPAPTGNAATDTANIQAAINQAHRAPAPNTDNYVVRFQPGTYVVNKTAGPWCILVYPGNTYRGIDGQTTTIKSNYPNPSSGTGNRLFSSVTWDKPDNLRPLSIFGLTFDGIGQTSDEQSSLVLISSASSSGERLDFRAENCHFKNNPASDGLHIVRDVDAKIFNCSADSTVRGGLTITQGYNVIDVRDFTMTNCHFHYEVDWPGYDDTWGNTMNATNVSTDRTLDIIAPGGGHNLTFTNVSSGSLYHFGSPGNVINFFDCPHLGTNNSDNHKFYLPFGVTFTNCTIVATYGGPGDTYATAFPLVYFQFNDGMPARSGERLTFNNSTFKTDGTFPDSVPVMGIGQTGDVSQTYDNRIICNNCTFDHTLNSAASLYLMAEAGGWMEFHDSTFNVDDTPVTGNPYFPSYPIQVGGNSAAGNFRLVIDNCTFNTNKYLYIFGYDDSRASGNIIQQGNFKTPLNTSQNIIGSEAGYRGNTFDTLDNSEGVMRKIVGSGVPGPGTPGFCSSDGMKFDQYYDTDSGKYYKLSSMNPISWVEYTPAQSQDFSPSDVNSDSKIDLLDLDILKTDFLKITASLVNPKSDIDQDGQATIKDIGIMMSQWKP